jgi:hypothetical protein
MSPVHSMLRTEPNHTPMTARGSPSRTYQRKPENSATQASSSSTVRNPRANVLRFRSGVPNPGSGASHSTARVAAANPRMTKGSQKRKHPRFTGAALGAWVVAMASILCETGGEPWSDQSRAMRVTAMRPPKQTSTSLPASRLRPW